MRILPENFSQNMVGSLSGGRMEFTAWYDGSPIYENLPVSDWSQSFEGGTQVSGSTSLSIDDSSGEMAPWGVDEALGVGGALIQTRLILDNSAVQLGWQRITASSSTETWRLAGNGTLWVSGGSLIEVTADDLTTCVSGSKFVSPEAPPTGNTCVAEIRRLLLGIMDVTFVGEIKDVPIPASVTYRDERMDAVEDLVAALGCSYRVSGTGQLVVYVPTQESVWTIKPGQFNGSLINVSRSQSITDLSNLIVARNTLQGGDELQAAAEETSGPLRVDGPHGRWPAFLQADFATNQYEIQEAAYQGLQSSLRSRSVSIPLTTIFHPGLELGDWVTVECPVTTGTTMPLNGRVSSISYSGKRIPLNMDIVIQSDLSAVQSISEALRAQRWSK